MLFGVNCILGYLVVSNPHNSSRNASSIQEAEKENILEFKLSLIFNLEYYLRLMTFHKSNDKNKTLEKKANLEMARMLSYGVLVTL